MQFPAILLAFLVAVVAAVTNQQKGDHPIASVIKLLRELRYKVEDEQSEEQATFVKLTKWCDDSKDTLVKAVASDKETIDTLSEEVDGLQIQEQSLKDKIAWLEEEILKYENEDTEAKTIRDEANALYTTNDGDFDTTIAAVGEAVTALKESKSAAFLQSFKPQNKRQEQALKQLMRQPLVLEQLSAEQTQAFSAAAFGEPEVTEADIMAKKKYAATGATYTFKSGTVIELLEGLKTHFEDAKETGTKAETAAVNEYEVAKGARKDAIDTAKSTKTTKEEDLGTCQGDLNTAKSSLGDEKDELKSNSETLKNTEQLCDRKAQEFKTRQQLRVGEIAAMKAATMILSDVAGVRHEENKNEAMPDVPTMLLQTVNPKMKAVNLLKQEAIATHSKALAQFADQLAAKLGGSFDEITGMVQKMIFRLMAEQKDEDDHKNWCDMEVSVSEKSKEDKTAKVATLDTEIDDAKAHVDELALKITSLEKKVADLTTFLQEATEVRAEGKKENKITIKDAEDAQSAIAKATAVLETYYKDSGMIEKEAWEFIQAPDPVKLPEEPSSWDASYTGVTDPKKAGTGVITVLKAAAEKFATLEGKTRAQEVADQTLFDETMQSESINKAKAEKEAEMKTDEKKRTVDKVNALEKKRKSVANELAATEKYLEDLKAPCIDGDSSYEDRKASRTKEIGALKEAQGILEKAFEDKSFLQIVHKH